ncbi:MAG: shikimate kinase [Bacteroidetes bacterium]|nr:shikimate kinase [Bacteroidota bacterium]
MNNAPLFLVGYMGAGKAPSERYLQHAWDEHSLIWMTSLSLSTTPLSPIYLVNTVKEYFREKETEALHQLKGKENLVIATGGGAASGDNMQWMNKHGSTIYLRCHPGVLFHRIAPAKSKRPLLSGMEDVDIMEYMVESLKKRLPFYIQARHTVNGDNDPEQVVESILKTITGVPTNFSQD